MPIASWGKSGPTATAPPTPQGGKLQLWGAGNAGPVDASRPTAAQIRLQTLQATAAQADAAVAGNKGQTVFGKIAQYGPSAALGTGKTVGNIGIGVARQVPNAFANIGESLLHQGAKQAQQSVSSTVAQLQKLNFQARVAAIKNNPGLALVLKNNGVNISNPIDSELFKANKTLAGKAQKASNYTPGSRVEKIILGKQPVQSYQQRAEGYQKELQGSKVDLPGVHHTFTGIPGKILQGGATPIATALGLAQFAGDATSITGAANADKIISKLGVGDAKTALATAQQKALLQKAKIGNTLGRTGVDANRIPAGQKLLSTGQKKLPAVTDSTKGKQVVPGGSVRSVFEGVPKDALPPDARIPKATFGKAATAPAKAAKVQTKVEIALNNIDERLAKVDRGEITMSPEERKSLFQTRQVLDGKAPAVRSETQQLVKAVTEAHAKVSAPSIEQTVAKAPKPGKSYGTVSATTGEKAFKEASAAPKKTILGSLRNKFNPVSEFGAKGKQVLSEFQTKLGSLSSDLRPVQKESAARQAVFDKMSQEEQLKFIDNIQHGQKQTTPELQKLADTYAGFNKQGAEVAGKLNPNFKTRNNYFTQAGLVSKKDISDQIKAFMDKSNLPGSTKARSFESVREAVKFANDNNIPLRETNPEKLFMQNHQAVLTSGRLNEFKAEQLAKGVDPAITQKIIDRFSERGVSISPLFQRYRQAAGSVNNVQLVGGFHFAKSAFEKINNDVSTAIHEITAGHPIFAAKDAAKNIVQNAKGLGYLQGRGLAKDVANGVSNKYTEAARLANFNTSTDSRFAVRGLSNALKQTGADLTSGKLGKTAKGAVLAVPRTLFGSINTVMKPLMNKFVPNLKNAAFMNQVDAADHILGPNATKEARALAYQKAGNTVDGIMGQMNQDNLFWSKTAKDTLSVLMRSPGYNIGTVQQVGGGLKDLATLKGVAKGEGLTTRASYTVAMTANTMFLGAVATYLATGKGPTKMIDYFYPPTGKTDKNGNAERIALPSYAKDVFAFEHNPVQTVSNKLSPALSTGAQIATNKDFFGNMVRNPQDSLGTQLKQTLSYAGKNTLPFSITNANKRVDKGAGAKAQSFLGFGVAPGYITKSKFEQNVQSALNTALGSKPLTPEQQKVVNDKSTAKQAQQSGDSSKIDALVKSGQITDKQAKALKYSSTQTSLSNQFQYLIKVDRPAAAKLIQNAGPDDIKKLGDINSLIKALNKTSSNKNAKQSTKDATYKLLQVLNSKR